MSRLFKRTKILATIGPAVMSEAAITDLIMAGVNACRLNFSHGNYEERDEQIRWIRAAAAKKGRSVSIVQDLQGPKIRLGELQNNHLDVKEGDELILDSSIQKHDGGFVLPVQYNLAERMRVGEPLFMFDGKIRSHVVEIVSPTAIKVRVENPGFLMSKKGLNLPDTDFGGDIITEKDLADIEFGASRDFDYVALSFVQSAADIDKLRQILLSHGSTARIIAKIETKRAIATTESLEAIVEASDGIMIARGDMAVEAGAEVVPVVQSQLVRLCRKHSKLCIVATQMMGSMVENPQPSRAEVSDVANAVIQGADAVMLSDETANGKYPLEAVKAMKRVILYTQNHSRINPLAPEDTPRSDYAVYNAISSSVARLAERINADVIICQTTTGATVEALAAERPNLPIVAVTPNARVASQLALTYATAAFVREEKEDYGIDLARELKASGYLKLEENQSDLLAVIVSGSNQREHGTDTIKVRYI